MAQERIGAYVLIYVNATYVQAYRDARLILSGTPASVRAYCEGVS